MPVYQLPEEIIFPPTSHAEPDGLLAVGGDLSPERLVKAYQSGIFPWFSEGDPILWWTPNPRFVLFPGELHISRSTRRAMNKHPFRYTFNQRFDEVLHYCKTVPREGQNGTWITPEMASAYTALHHLGYAVSVEVWKGDQLVGGIYGVISGRCFFGESMFSLVSNASKLGIIQWVLYLKSQNFRIIDCQMHSPHMQQLGGRHIPRSAFEEVLNMYASSPAIHQKWDQQCLNPSFNL